MKRLKTDIDGGMPIVLDDIRFMYESLSDTVKGLVSTYMGTGSALILSGCEITSSGSPNVVLNFAPGYIAYDGEVYYFEGGQNLVFIPNGTYFVVNKNYLPEGNKSFKYTGSQDTYEVVTLGVVTSYSAPAEYLFHINDMMSVDAYIETKIQTEVNKVVHPDVIKYQNIGGTGYTVKVLKEFRGTIHLQGKVHATVDPLVPVTELFELPEEFRPATDVYLQVFRDASVRGMMVISTSTGKAAYFGDAGGGFPSGDFVVYLDGISFF